MSSELGVNEATKPEARLDGLGIFWITFAIVWTLLVAGGMAFLYRRRDMPMLRIRGLPLSFAAVILLHLYWGAVQGGYCYGPIFPPVVEFWIMGIWLPFGIALFHASNSRFLHIAKNQKKLFASNNDQVKPARVRRSGLLGRYRGMDYTNKMLLLVSVGMLFQLFLTIFMYLISRKFHPSFGIPGTEVTGTEMQQNTLKGRGWEWWPSVFWQFFWAWIVAPIILWKSRGIRDTQGWRVQTIACCLANLHATPMWLVALYVPAMESVNDKWIPPQWIAISIMMLEIFTIFLPCWEVLRHQSLRQETLDSIAQWESNNKVLGKGGSRSVATGSATMAGSALTSWSKDGSVKSGSGESILTMGALEYVLERNPEPLQQFSALRDFSGENIAFLRSVAEWKSSLPASARDPEKSKDSATQELVRERFNSALRIYTNFISSRDAEFQVNLSSQDLKKLENVFESSARIIYGEKRAVDPATPFDTFLTPTTKVDSSASSAHGSEKGIISNSSMDEPDLGDKALYWGEIPADFDETIFDDAEASIKYLVLTNTWPKFVKDRRCSLDSNDTLESGNAIPAMAR
ncbi:Fc.00g033520.m01.CDS01 [Cosmosporella sp. VM-42]